MKNFALLALLLTSVASLNPFGPFARADVSLTGAGATFPYPLYSKWFAEYHTQAPDVQINYQSIGSGGGIRQFTDKTIDFGATDAPMTDEQLDKLTAPAVHVPTVLGAVAITYNLPGVTGLKLSPATLAGIFLGKITTWNDPQIAATNAGVALPATAILVADRSDGSGTTFVFSDYLAKVSPDWKTKVGAGTALNWPVGLGGKGNEGVTGMIKQAAGAIGYVELIFAENNHLPVVALKNQAGEFIAPSPKAVTTAAEASLKSIPADFRVSITDAPGKGSYPLSSFTYLLVPKDMKPMGAKGRELKKFLKWALSSGQKLAEPLAYAPLPASLAKKVDTLVTSLGTE
jgi:phosphate transport system substrate-binding protein